MKKAPRLVRLFGLGVGDGANMATLAGLSSGGFAERLNDNRSAARAALRLLEAAEKTTNLGASFDLGANVERVYPRELGAVSAGETVFVVGRVTGESPKEATLSTPRGKSTIKLAVTEARDSGDLRRRWALGRLDELLAENAGHAALVDLGVRQGIITPVTSIYVPTSKEMTREQRDSIDRRKRKRVVVVEAEASKPEEAASKGAAASAAATAAASAAAPNDELDGRGSGKKGRDPNAPEKPAAELFDLEDSRGDTDKGGKGEEGQMASPKRANEQKEEAEKGLMPRPEPAAPTATAAPQGAPAAPP